MGLAESAGKYWIRVDPDGNGRWDWGLFQINDVHPDLLAMGDPFDPFDNAAMAYALFVRAGYKWTDWSAFNNKSFEQFLPRAEKVTT